MILALVVAVPHMLSLKIMGETNVYSFIPVFLMGMCAAKYELADRWLQVWNRGPKKIMKFLLEVLILFVLYKVYGKLPGSVYNEIRWGIFPIIVIAFCSEFITVIPGIPPGTVIPWKTFHEYFSDTYIYKTLFLE